MRMRRRTGLHLAMAVWGAMALAVCADGAQEAVPPGAEDPAAAAPAPSDSGPAAPSDSGPAAPAEAGPGAAAAETPAPAAETPAAAPGAFGLPENPKSLSHHFPVWTTYELLGVAVWQGVLAFVFLLAGLALKKVSDFVFERKVVPTLAKTRLQFDHLVAGAFSKPFGYVVLLGGVAAAVWVLALPEEPTDVRRVAFAALKVLLVADILWFLFRLVDVLAIHLTRLAGRTSSQLDDQLVPLVRKALKLTIGAVLAVWVVQLLGYSVSSLLAGLGIGGLAVALALQDTLANFFGSVFIFLDRPFIVGDMVKIDDVEGIVEQIGFRTTRIRTWPKTLVAMPNKKVAEATIDNLSRMPSRRVLQTVGVTYETTADQMEQATAAIRDLIARDEGVDPGFLVVRFEDFGASSLDIKVIYFTKAIPYADHVAAKERINLGIMRALEALGLSIAFPTRTVYFEGDVARVLMRPGRDDASPASGRDDAPRATGRDG